MRFSLAIAIALLLGSYAVGVPVSSPEEGEISDHENGSNGQNGSPGQNGHTPASQHSGGTGTSSNPSMGLGLSGEHRGEIGSVQLGHYASPPRYNQDPGNTNHWARDHPAIGHGQRDGNVAITPMTSTRQGGQPAGNFGVSGHSATTRLETQGGPRFVPSHAFQPGAQGMQQTHEGYNALVRDARHEIAARPDGPPPPTPHNPSYNPVVNAPLHWQPGQGPPPPPGQGMHPGMYQPHRQATLPVAGPHGGYQGAPTNPPPQFPPLPQHHGLPPRPQGGLPPLPQGMPMAPQYPPQTHGLPPRPQGGFPPNPQNPPSHLPPPPAGLPPRPQGGLPPNPAGLPPRPPSRGRGGSLNYGTNRYNPYGGRPSGGGGSGSGV